MSRWRAWPAALLGLLLAACAETGAEREDPDLPVVEVSGFIVRNALVHAVTDVMVEAPATGRFAGCGNILPRSECRSAFQTIEYRQNEIVVSWKERGEPRSTDPFLLELPPDLEEGKPVWLEVVIYAPGLAGARMVQP